MLSRHGILLFFIWAFCLQADELPSPKVMMSFDFEKDVPNAMIQGFTVSPGQELVATTDKPQKGKQAMRCSVNGKGSVCGSFPTLKTAGVKQVLLTGWFRSTRFCHGGGWVDGGTGGYMRIQTQTGDGKWVISGQLNFPYTPVLDWKPFSFTLRLPERTEELRLDVTIDSGGKALGGDVFLDELLLLNVDPLTADIGKKAEPYYAYKLFHSGLFDQNSRAAFGDKLSVVDDKEAKYYPRVAYVKGPLQWGMAVVNMCISAIPPGRYLARYWIKSEPGSEGTQVAQLRPGDSGNVFNVSGTYAITAADFKKAGDYQSFDIIFDKLPDGVCSFDLMQAGTIPFYADCVELFAVKH